MKHATPINVSKSKNITKRDESNQSESMLNIHNYKDTIRQPNEKNDLSNEKSVFCSTTESSMNSTLKKLKVNSNSFLNSSSHSTNVNSNVNQAIKSQINANTSNLNLNKSTSMKNKNELKSAKGSEKTEKSKPDLSDFETLLKLIKKKNKLNENYENLQRILNHIITKISKKEEK